MQTLFIRGIQGCCGHYGPRIWTLLQYANLLPSWRLPYRTISFRSRATRVSKFSSKCNIESRNYKIFGYKGKQVRDNIHSQDVARFIGLFLKQPIQGEVYNLGGGKKNSCSIIEAFRICEDYSGKKQKYEYLDENRIGDHICYYSDLTKIKKHYPEFKIEHSLTDTIRQMVLAQSNRQS